MWALVGALIWELLLTSVSRSQDTVTDLLLQARPSHTLDGPGHAASNVHHGCSGAHPIPPAGTAILSW